jgi:predicted RNase H-like nuclease (RuvC/YqgF family)
MSLSMEKYLYQIDQSFAEKSDRDIKLIYAMVFVAMLFVSYLFWDSAEQGYNKAKKASMDVQQKINMDKQYLMVHPESEIAQIEAQIKSLEGQLIVLKDNNAYIKAQIEQISELFYDEQSWGEYIDSIAENAKKYKVKLNFFANRMADDKNRFGHVLNIDVAAEGKYQNLLKFTDSVEKSFLVVDIHDLDFRADEKLYLDLNLSVWGITY